MSAVSMRTTARIPKCQPPFTFGQFSLRGVAPSTNGHPMRLEAAGLRRDIDEAHRHIRWLQRRYPSGDERIQQRPVGEQHRVVVGVQVK